MTSRLESDKLVNQAMLVREGRQVTVGIVVACKDGIVVGADRKVVRSRGTRVKSLESKITRLMFKDGRNLLVCYSGTGDFGRRGIGAIDPSGFDECRRQGSMSV